MKSFFLSIIAALGSIFGIHSHAVVSSTPTYSASSTMAILSDDQRLPPDITFPLGSDVLYAGRTYTITWRNINPALITYMINLEYVTNSGVYIGQVLGTASSTQQSFSFKVPTDIFPRTNYQVYFINLVNNHILTGTQAFTIK